MRRQDMSAALKRRADSVDLAGKPAFALEETTQLVDLAILNERRDGDPRRATVGFRQPSFVMRVSKPSRRNAPGMSDEPITS